MKCLVRERIDVEGDPRVSYMHKVWAPAPNVTPEEFYKITVTPSDQETGAITEAEWLELCKTHPPQPTYPNSDWGCGLPGAGDIWKDIPAWERGAE